MLLTKEIREKIVSAALEKSELPKMRKKVQKDLVALAKQIYKSEVEVPAEIAALPVDIRTHWLRSETQIQIYANGYDKYSHFQTRGDKSKNARNRLDTILRLEDPVLVPVRFGTVDVRQKPALKDAAAAVIAAHLAANDYEDELRAKLNAIVATANTDAQLLATWPEGKPFIPAPKAKSRALVDTKTVLEVNDTLGLNKK